MVIVGGMGVLNSLLKSEELRNKLIEADYRGKTVGAICLAPMILAQAGLLRNKPATCLPQAQVANELKRNGAIFTN